MTLGMNRHTGKALDGMDHLRQSIIDILTTRIGTRIMRRDYGADVPNIIDAPVNDTFTVNLYVAVSEALEKWEPRLKLNQINVENIKDGSVTISFKGVYLPNGKPIKMEGIVVK